MNLRQRLARYLFFNVQMKRDPDFTVGGIVTPAYLKRWWLIPRNPILNVYYHQFLRSDYDDAFHDHPWWNMSLVIDGAYIEHTVKGMKVRSSARWGTAFAFRWAKTAHRVELIQNAIGREIPVWTIFITGPRFRTWGFHCPKGWIPWTEFVQRKEKGNDIGAGCGDT